MLFLGFVSDSELNYCSHQRLISFKPSKRVMILRQKNFFLIFPIQKKKKNQNTITENTFQLSDVTEDSLHRQKKKHKFDVIISIVVEHNI